MVVVSGKTEVAGLWIDYVLLPEKLDEHLAKLEAGETSLPGHAELVNMFLEQAVSNYKSRKEPDAQGGPTVRVGSRTASVLCERAVRVAVAAGFTLADIEVSVPRNQALLFKALIKYDKQRSLVHECNFYRWVIHKALAQEPLATSTSKVSGCISVDSSEIFQDGISLDGSHLDEGPSVSFLESVLEREKVLEESHEDKERMKKKPVNGVIREGKLSDELVCQILFDVAEVHFMRGRLKRAHELFNKCGLIAAGIAGSSFPVSQDRLNGFIVACRGVSGSAATLQSEHRNASHEAVLACEKNRSSNKRKLSSDLCNGVHDETRSKKAATVKSENGEEHVPNGCELKTPTVKLEHKEVAQDFKDLVEAVAGDILTRHLSWSYLFTLERDQFLSATVRLKLAICNVLRVVIEGGAFDSVLRIADQLNDNKEAMMFLMKLLARVIRGAEEELVRRVRQFCIYVCCTVEQTWCWNLASRHGLVSDEFTSKLAGLDSTAPNLEQDSKGEGSGLVLLDLLQVRNVKTALDQALWLARGLGSGESPQTVARIVQLRAFDALEKDKDLKLSRELYDLAKYISPGSMDNELCLWYLDKMGPRESAALPEKAEEYDRPSYGVVEYIFVKLMEAEQWTLVQELCTWAQHRPFMEDRAVGFVFKEASVLGSLISMCCGGASLAKTDDIIRTLEELMALLFLNSRDEGSRESWTLLKTLPIISKLSKVDALEPLENLLAGWINRLHVGAPLVERARYGALAQATANSKSRVPDGSRECGKKLLDALLQRLLKLPNASEEEGRGCRWLLGLADLAFVDQAYLKALQLYLRAGAVRSSFYCDRMTSMARDLFTPWVITRMIVACKEVGAQLQAAILCQCLPEPDYESAFEILQANPLIVDQDAASYLECVWEIPLLELLVHMHAKAGDRARVNTLIGLLQQPAMNVHNPASIRRAHIAALEQRFLQRFYAELM